MLDASSSFATSESSKALLLNTGICENVSSSVVKTIIGKKLTNMFVRSTHIVRPWLIKGIRASGFDLIVGRVGLHGADGKSELST